MAEEKLELSKENIKKSFLSKLKSQLFIPLAVLASLITLNIIYKQYFYLFEKRINLPVFNFSENLIYWLSLGLIGCWIVARIINAFSRYLLATATLKEHSTIYILLPLFSTVLKTICFLTIFNLIAPHLGFPAELADLLGKITKILIILAIARVLFKAVAILGELITHRYAEESLNSRKVHTQILILKRVAILIISILTIGAILMLFDSVRALGASVLTTAGVIGIVLTFTAQRSLASIFAGLELALSQPIKIGDSIVIENECGVIEEINFRNVIVKLSDWRRLVVPTNYFLERSFQNWSRDQTTNLIGTVYMYTDFTLPLDSLREELHTILADNPLWDGEISTVEVSDLQERVMQLRILVSAHSPKDAWDLQCEVREKLIGYIAKNHLECLPVTRSKTEKNILDVTADKTN